jgi:[NiFe] hydrogenase diaphorase moiety small subunit
LTQAALAAGSYIPHLCYHPEFKPHGSCKLCTVKVNGRPATSCTLPVAAGMEIESETPELKDKRRMLLQMLFVEGNHFCPSCEKSGDCVLQALGYDVKDEDAADAVAVHRYMAAFLDPAFRAEASVTSRGIA